MKLEKKRKTLPKEERDGNALRETLASLAFQCDSREWIRLHRNATGITKCSKSFVHLCRQAYCSVPDESITHCSVCIGLWYRGSSLRGDSETTVKTLDLLSSYRFTKAGPAVKEELSQASPAKQEEQQLEPVKREAASVPSGRIRQPLQCSLVVKNCETQMDI